MTMLHAIELPPRGGDTQFANTAAGYAALLDETKREIAGLQVEHSWEASRRNLGAAPITEEQKRERPPVTHPLVRTHPDTGAKTLYLGLHTSHVLGTPEAPTSGERATSCCGTTAACCTARCGTTRWRRTGASCSARW